MAIPKQIKDVLDTMWDMIQSPNVGHPYRYEYIYFGGQTYKIRIQKPAETGFPSDAEVVIEIVNKT